MYVSVPVACASVGIRRLNAAIPKELAHIEDDHYDGENEEDDGDDGAQDHSQPREVCVDKSRRSIRQL